MRKYTKYLMTAICSVALTSAAGLATARAADAPEHMDTTTSSPSHAKTDARSDIREAASVVDQMKKDPQIKDLLRNAQGVFIAPDYARAAFGVGGQGGEGVLLVKKDGKWSDPAFFDFGGGSVGAEAGAETGSLAMILNTQKAVDQFKQNNNWSLNAQADLTVVNWSGKKQVSAGKDVVLWSNTKGLFAGGEVTVTDIRYDGSETASYYGKQTVSLNDVINGNVENSQASTLKDALPG
jgi:SH3 domain-containing YSC84-like protein 1